jgi:hypothetical protein
MSFGREPLQGHVRLPPARPPLSRSNKGARAVLVLRLRPLTTSLAPHATSRNPFLITPPTA